MANTEYKFDPEWVKNKLVEYKTNLLKNRNRTDFVEHACEVIKKRLEDKPQEYLSYGPYWWALKKVLKTHDAGFGNVMDDLLAEEYTGDTEEETIVMAEEFRNDYYKKFFEGNDEFVLDPDSPAYVLEDKDYETAEYRGRFSHLGLSEEEEREWEQMAAFFGDDFLNK